MSVLLTERLKLRSAEQSDVQDIVALANDFEVARWLENMPHPFEEPHAESFVNSSKKTGFLITSRSTDELIGILHFIPTEEGRLNIGYWVGQKHWRNGYAFEALFALTSHLLLEKKWSILEAKVLFENEGSIKLLEKIGFQQSGNATCNPVTTGETVNVAKYTITKAHFESLYVVAGCALPVPEKEVKLVLVAAVALIDADGRILLAQRPEGKSMAGLWEFPGGKVEKGETPEAALKRELKEELDISTEASCLAPLTFASHTYDDFHLMMPVYACRTYQGRPVGKEGQNLKWVPISKLREYPMPEADIPLIALIQDYL